MANDDKPAKPRRARLGRDGRPLKPRPRKRRNSEDVKRDALVEEVLKESRLDMYDEPSPEPQQPAGSGDGDDEAADEKIAEQFRKDFLAAMEMRRRHRAPGQPKPPGEAAHRGPKLGGSRSARAAMREKGKDGAGK